MATKKHKTKPITRSSWPRLAKDNLLQLRICDLGLTLENSPIVPRISRLYRELERQRLPFKPHFWLSDDWFCPDDIPGVAIPFFLVHPRLKKLEREFMKDVEGDRYHACMKLLRHETGHALANAYKLTKRRDWRKMFGNPNSTYHDSYLPRPYSKRFVVNLPGWYAQSHPHEDWAETFAVWLTPNSEWRKRYRSWPALKKLCYVDELMKEIREKRPIITNKRTEYPVEKITITLSEYYQDKTQRYGLDSPEFFDFDLRKLFVSGEEAPTAQKASRYIRHVRRPTMDIVQRWTGEYKYRINEVLQDMIKRCDKLNLRVDDSKEDMLPDIASCVTMVVMNKMHSGGFNLSR